MALAMCRSRGLGSLILRLTFLMVFLIVPAAALAAPIPVVITDGTLFVNPDTAFTLDPLRASGVGPIDINRINAVSTIGPAIPAIDPCCTASARIGFLPGAELRVGAVTEAIVFPSFLTFSGGPVTPNNTTAPFSLTGLITTGSGTEFQLQGSGFANTEFTGGPGVQAVTRVTFDFTSTVIPEPSPLALVTAGLIALFGVRLKRSSKKAVRSPVIIDF